MPSDLLVDVGAKMVGDKVVTPAKPEPGPLATRVAAFAAPKERGRECARIHAEMADGVTVIAGGHRCDVLRVAETDGTLRVQLAITDPAGNPVTHDAKGGEIQPVMFSGEIGIYALSLTGTSRRAQRVINRSRRLDWHELGG